MASRPRLIGSVLLSGISEASNLCTFLLGILAARYLGYADFGRFSFALAFTAIFQLLPDFGVSYASTIEIARDRSKAGFFVGNIVGLQIVTSLATAALIVACTVMAVPPAVQWVVIIAAATMILRTFKLTFRWLLKSFERFDIEAATLVATRTASLVFGWVLLARGGGLVSFVLMLLVVQAVDTVATSLFVHRVVAPVFPRFALATGWALLRKGFPFALMYSLVYMFFQINTVVLAYVRTDAEVGWFNAPYRILEGLVIIPSAISYGLLPTFSILHMTDREALSDLYRKALKYLFIISLPLAVFVTFESADLVALVFGPGYMRSVPVFKVLIWAAVFMFLSHLASTLLTCIDRQWTVIRIAAGVLILNILLNVALVPAFGMMGAAWVSLATELFFTLVLVVVLRLYGFRLRKLAWMLRPAAACAVFAVATAATVALPVIWQGLICGIVYAAALWFLRAFDESEIAAARSFLTRKIGRAS